MNIITEEMKYRKRLCEYALNYGVTKAARKYHTNRMFVYRQLTKYDGNVRSLALKSRKPLYHPKQHTKEELGLIKKTNSRYRSDGLAEVYVQLLKRGYQRSYASMCKQIKNTAEKTTKYKRTSYAKHKEIRGEFPGEKVQVDIKYVPQSTILFNSHGKRYYQITAIDESSRKRYLSIVDEKSVTHTSEFVKDLERKLGFKIHTIQTDNGSEFVNNSEQSKKETRFELTLKELGIKHKRTKPYSPWQNGKVERSHRIDNERFYSKAEFRSEKDMNKKVKRYNNRQNNVARKVLGFKSPNEIVNEYLNQN